MNKIDQDLIKSIQSAYANGGGDALHDQTENNERFNEFLESIKQQTK